MVDVTVKVPATRIGEFYSMFGSWLTGANPVSYEAPEASGDKAAWTLKDGELARRVWAKFSEPARGLFSILIDAPESRFSGDDLAERVGIPNGKHGVAGVLAWPGRHSFAVGRDLPWSWAYPTEGGNAVYWFTTDIAELFRQARDQ